MDTVPKLRAPIVLVHGLLGFNTVRVFDVALISYFRGIAPYLSKSGNRVYTTRDGPADRVWRRAQRLKQFLDRVAPAESVHLFAHSMGGLDSRYAIAKLGLGDRVLTLTTLGTPHRGTPFADWGMRRWGFLLRPSILPFHPPVPALIDLTTDACREFNKRVPDDPRVRYFSVAAQFAGRLWDPMLGFPSYLIQQVEGDNDGLVSVASARYGESCDVWNGDHLSLVNWPTLQTLLAGWTDRRRQYGELVQRLADLGY